MQINAMRKLFFFVFCGLGVGCVGKAAGNVRGRTFFCEILEQDGWLWLPFLFPEFYSTGIISYVGFPNTE
jgi:hypothetical protein